MVDGGRLTQCSINTVYMSISLISPHPPRLWEILYNIGNRAYVLFTYYLQSPTDR